MPSKEKETFKNVVLDSGIINMGAKLKILANLRDFDHKIIEKIRKMAHIRNAVAHNNPGIQININKNSGKGTASEFISVMSSSAKLQSKEFSSQIAEFNSYFEIVITYLQYYSEGLTNK